MKRRRRPLILLLGLLLGLATALGSLGGASAQTLAGFESGSSFEGLDHVLSLTPSADWASQGARSLRIAHGSIPAGDQNRLWIRVAEELNWVGATTVQADFFVPETAPHQYSAALMIQVGDGWTWYESAPVPLVPGENLDVTFRLDNTEWRSAATNWSLGAMVPLANIRAYGFLVFSDRRDPGTVYLDNVRLVRPEIGGAPGVAPSGLTSFSERIRISGNAELKVVSQPKTVEGEVPRVPLGLVPSLWEIDPGSGRRPTLVTTTDPDGNTVQALRVEGLLSSQVVRVDLAGADMSAYKYLYMDIKQVGGTSSKGLQFIMQDSAFNWYDTQHFPHVPADGWYRAVLTVDQFQNDPSFSDIRFLGFRTFDGDADFLIANVYFAGDAEDAATTTELTRTHEIKLDLDYQLSPDWSVQLGAILSDPVVRMGLLQIKGSAGPVSVRAFQNGNGSDLGDPLNLFKAEKYHKNATTGLDVTALVGSTTLRGMALAPSDGEPGKDRIGAARLDVPFGSAGEASLLAVQQGAVDAERATSLGAAGKVTLGRVGLTGEVLSTLSAEEGLAWMLEAGAPVTERIDLTLHARVVGKGVIPSYNDHSTHNGYGQRHVDAKWRISDALQAGAYLQNWYRTDDSWNELRHKLSLDWRGPGFTLASYTDTKRIKEDGAYAFDSGRTSVKVTSKLADFADVTGLLWLTKPKSGASLPAYLGRVGFEPLPGVALTLEAARVKEAAAADVTENFYAKVVRKLRDGELSLAYGKPTLNDDEDKFNNTQTAKDYVEVKLVVNF